ncbi:MAG: hypothetical protein ACREPQ_14440 [Rhodanobacter sp.]
MSYSSSPLNSARQTTTRTSPQKGIPNLKSAPQVDTLTDLFDRLVKADLTAAGYRVILDTMARLISQSRATEAVPTQWMADRLGLHRNAIGAAYADLEKSGLLRRIAVLTRGAPTRTTLTGPALRTTRLVCHGWILHDDANAVGAGAGAGAVNDGRELVESEPVGSPQEVPATGAKATPDHSRAQHHPAVTHSESADQACSTSNQNPDSGPNRQAAGPAQTTREDAVVDRIFSPEIHATVSAKVPGDAMYAVLSGRLAKVDVSPDWGLTEDETNCLLSLAPKRERATARSATTQGRPALAAVPTRAHPELASEVWKKLPRITQVLGEKRAGEVIDEIAFSISCLDLGRGDLGTGIRAAMSLVGKGVWQRPYGFTADWRGAVLRGLQQA